MTQQNQMMYIEYSVASSEPTEIFQKRIRNILEEFAVHHPCNLKDSYLIYHYFMLYWSFTSPTSIKFTQTYYFDKTYNDPGFDMALRHELYVLQDNLESVAHYSTIKHNVSTEMFEYYELDPVLDGLSEMKIA